MQDNVATALEAIEPGTRATIGTPDGQLEIEAGEPIPICHKIALEALPAGTTVRKYGEPIGRTTADVPAGGLVHVHNMRSLRAVTKTDA